MKAQKKIKIFSFVLAPLSFLIPVLVSAQTQITIATSVPGTYGPKPGTGGPGAFVANFYQFSLIIAGVLAFGVIVYGGIRYMTSAGNPSGASDAKEWIEAALLGLLLLAGAYFILKVINPQLLNLDLPTLAPGNIATTGSTGGNGTGTGTGGSGSSSANCKNLSASTTGGGTQAAKIDAAAVANCGASSANGPGNGTVSCAWEVNNVLTSAGIANLDSTSVQSMENALKAGRGTIVNPSQAQPGDIVIQAQDGHVGICLNVGCTQVISNSSSNASFTWISNTSFSPSYSGGPGRIYHLNG